MIDSYPFEAVKCSNTFSSSLWRRGVHHVSTQTRNLPVMELSFPFPVLAPISSTVLFWIPLPEIFHLVRYPNAQFASTGTGRDSCRPISGIGLCQFRYGHSIGPVPELDSMPVPVRSFTGPRTGTEICAVGKPVGGFVGSAHVGVGLLTRNGRDGIRRLRPADNDDDLRRRRWRRRNGRRSRR